MGTIYRTNGDTEGVQPLNGEHYSLEQLQGIVGGYIELVASRDGKRLLVVNEEGKLQQIPTNANATRWVIIEGRPDIIMGDAVEIGAGEIE